MCAVNVAGATDGRARPGAWVGTAHTVVAIAVATAVDIAVASHAVILIWCDVFFEILVTS